MSKAAEQRLRDDLPQLEAQKESLKHQEYQITQEAQVRLQQIRAEIQAVQQRIAEINEILKPPKQ